MLTALAFRAIHAIHAHPLLRVAIGLLVTVLGVLLVVLGGGHGGLVAAGIVLGAGGVSAAVSGRQRSKPSDD